MIIALHILYVVSFLLYLGALIFYYIKNEEALRNKEPRSTLDEIESRFFLLLLISFFANVLSFGFLLSKQNYLGDENKYSTSIFSHP